MALRDASLVINTLRSVGARNFILIGGEPTLHPHLDKIIKLIRGTRSECTLVTNARRAHDLRYARKLAISGLTEATVSLHGWSTESYMGIGNLPIAFEEAIEGYFNLKDVGIRVGIIVVIGRHTMTHAQEIIDFINGLGVRQFGVNIATPAVSKSRVTGDFTLSISQYREQVLEMFNKCKQRGINVSFQLGLPLCIFTKHELLRLKSSNAIKQGCHIIRGKGIVIKPDLSPTICTHLMDFDLIDQTSSRHVFRSPDTFLEFWNSQPLLQLCENANVYRTKRCKGCELWLECGGGCMINWAFHNPRDIKMRFFDHENAQGVRKREV